MRTAALVVTYNRLEMLKECIAHLLAQSVQCDILVVNNHSTDGTDKWLEEKSAEEARVLWCDTGENVGGAGGFNRGMRWAVKAGYDRVWIMDDDTIPERDALQELLRADALLEGQYGFLSSAALWTDGSECRMNRQELKKMDGGRTDLLQQDLALCAQATFVSCFFTAEMIRRAGLPIAEFFIWGDDVEYTRRLSVRMGMPCYLVKRSRVVHAMQENTGSSIALDAHERIGRYNYAFRNENYLYRREGWKGFLYYTAKCGLNFFRIILKAKDKKPARCMIIAKQFFCGLFFNPQVEYVMENEDREMR